MECFDTFFVQWAVRCLPEDGKYKSVDISMPVDSNKVDAILSAFTSGTEITSRYSKTCVRQPPLKLTSVVDVERWLSYKGTCHVILLAKLHDMYLYRIDNFFHINHYLKSVSKVALLHRFYCKSSRLHNTQGWETSGLILISGLRTFILSMKFLFNTRSQD